MPVVQVNILVMYNILVYIKLKTFWIAQRAAMTDFTEIIISHK